MPLHVIALRGCAPTPLAHYLKALGILRLVATQADPRARGAWRGDLFHLASTLDGAELIRFFLDRYAPTPLLAPWNGGSGFYPRDNKEGIDAISRGLAARFGPYRDAIALAREAVGQRTESPKDEAKAELIRTLRATWSEDALVWLDAALSLTGDDDVSYPALLGTGGNDGRLDFTNNQMQRLTELLDPNSGAPRPEAGTLLTQALLAHPVAGMHRDKAIGQFHPGAAGGANSSAEFSGKSLLNPWDFVLALEGAVVLRVAAVRKLDALGLSQAAAPFAVESRAAGYGSAAASEESARGEQWMPLWDGMTTYDEVAALFAEARLQLGTRRAQTALEAARAVARVGVSRGVGAFQRFGFIERNGQANLAVPLGRWEVRNSPEVSLLDGVASWLNRLRAAARAKGAGAGVARCVQQLEQAMLDVCRTPREGHAWQGLVILLGEAEAELVKRPEWTAEAGVPPAPPLPAREWLAVVGATTPEVRLAAAIASQRAPKQATNLGSIRVHMAPLVSESPVARFASGAGGLAKDPRVVWTGRALENDLGDLVLRRLQDGRDAGVSGFALTARVFARLHDVNAYLAGALDTERVARLVRGLVVLDWDAYPSDHSADALEDEPTVHPVPLHALFKSVYSPVGRREPPGQGAATRGNPRALRLLQAGQVGAAISAAGSQLTAAGLRPKLSMGVADAILARRLVASIAIPLHPRHMQALLRAACRLPALSTSHASH